VKELKEERAKEEIQQKLEAAGSRKRVDRVDWMYQGPSNGQPGTTEEMEGYLLGKRRIDGLIKGNDNKKLEKQAAEDSFMALQNANTLRDTAAKIREDPMLAIKRQEQAAYESMMNDPIKRRQLMAVIAGTNEKPVKKDKKHRRHHHRHGDDSGDERRRKRRRHDGDEREGRSRHRYSRHSPSHSPDARSASPDRGRSGDYKRERSYRRRSNSYSSRSPSPDRRRSSYPAGRHERDHRDDKKSGRHENGRGYEKGTRNGSYREKASNGDIKGKDEPDDREAERQKKLAAMQQDASKLDEDRERRLAALAEKEKADREVEEAARARSSKYGTKGDFMHSVHRKAGDMSLGDRMGRSTRGYQKDDD